MWSYGGHIEPSPVFFCTVREDKSSAFLGLARASVVEKINT